MKKQAWLIIMHVTTRQFVIEEEMKLTNIFSLNYVQPAIK